jgi:alpha-glucoside transport system permease protein
MNGKVKHFFSHLPLHVILVGIVLLWLLPTLGLLVTSFRPIQAIDTSGWWQVLGPVRGENEYTEYCAACHGSDGKKIAQANLTDPSIDQTIERGTNLLAMLKKPVNGQPHLLYNPSPKDTQASAISAYLMNISGIQPLPRFTLNNYIDAIMGYRGTQTYTADCASGNHPPDLSCTLADLTNQRGMGRAFLDSVAVTVPATILPILIAAFAAYAFSWFHFSGRTWMFALLVGLQVVPLQMTLVPISQLYAQLHLNGTFLGVWLFHTGFGLPYAIYLLRNFIGGLPRELFESAYLDGASHFTAFSRLALPLSIPAIASLGIFQFLWVWNDLLVALVFLGASNPVLTYQISNMVTSLGIGWQLLTAAAFLSMILPMIIFFSLQRFFVRGMLAGSVKG